MGITIDNYPIHSGLVDISGVYTYIRDINTTKDTNGQYTLNYLAYYEKEIAGVAQKLDVKSYYEYSSNVFTDTWTASYNHLKTKLDDLSLSYVDT